MASRAAQVARGDRQRCLRAQRSALYLMNYQAEQRTFSVMGAINTNRPRVSYMIQLQKGKLTCSCKDYTIRRRRCKHGWFVLLRMAKIPETHELAKKQYWSHEERAYFCQRLDANNVLSLRNQNLDQSISLFEEKGHVAKSIDVSDPNEHTMTHECPICFELMDRTKVSQCHQCKKWFHGDCLAHWYRINSSCPLCRSQT